MSLARDLKRSMNSFKLAQCPLSSMLASLKWKSQEVKVYIIWTSDMRSHVMSECLVHVANQKKENTHIEGTKHGSTFNWGLM